MNKIMVLCLCIFLFIPIVFSDTCDTTYLDDNTIVHYSFEETSKPYIDDTETINLTLGTDPERIDVSGSLNYTYGQNFTGSDESYSTANTLLKYDVFSFCYWYRADDITGSNMGLASYQTTQYGPGWRINMHKNDGSIVFDVYDGSANRDGSYNTVGSISEDVWYHACNVWDGDDGFTYIKGSSSIHYGDAHDTIAYAATQGLYVGNTEAFFSTADWSVAGWVYFDVALNETCRSYVRSNTYPYSDVVPPVISNINCTSCDANNITADRTPTFTLDTDESSNCGISSQNSSYTNCTTTGVLNHTCTIPVVDQLDYGIVNVFFNCTDGSSNSRTTSVEIEVLLINLTFVSPTPANNSVIYVNTTEIKINITNATTLEQFIFNWNGTNETQVKDIEFNFTEESLTALSFYNGTDLIELYNESLLVSYNFDNISNLGESDSTVVDVSGNMNATVIGASFTTSGRYNGAYSYDGTDDYMSAAQTDLDFKVGQEWTISTWVYRKDDISSGVLAIWGPIGVVDRNWLLHYDGTEYVLGIRGDANAPMGSTPLNEWHHLLSSYNGTHLHTYVNAVFNSSTATTVNGLGANEPLEIGRRGGSNIYAFNGSIDELRIWNRSFTSNEIQQIYLSNLNKFDTDEWTFYTNQTLDSYQVNIRGNNKIDFDKISSSNYLFSTNKTVVEGNYTFQGFAQDNLSNWFNTEERILRVLDPAPQIQFQSPTPTNGSTVITDEVTINVSITESTLQQFVYNWNGTNYTSPIYNLYDNDIDNCSVMDYTDTSLHLALNFDNISSLGETTSHLFDLSPAGNNGTISGGVVYNTSGYYGLAMEFDGVEDCINVGDVINNLSFTKTAWVNRQTGVFANNIISGGGNGDILWATSSYSYRLTAGHGSSLNIVQDPIPLEVETWYHVAVSYDGDGMYLYKDGKLVDSATGVTLDSDPGVTYVGCFAGNNSWNGRIDEPRIWNISLSETEIKQIYLSTLNMYESNEWEFSTTQHNLIEGNYTFQAYATDSNDRLNSTEERQVTIQALDLVIGYPTEYTLYQRHNDTHGEIKIQGIYGTTNNATSIDARFNGGDWVTIDASPSGNSFIGYLNATIGNGTLDIAYGNNYSINTSVYNISIGDLYVVGGQSNAYGTALHYQNLSDSNNYLSTVFIYDNTWKINNDPTTALGVTNGWGSAWPNVANYVIQNQSVPVSFIAAATPGAQLFEWIKGGEDYDNMIEMTAKATNGTMKIKSYLFFQGENDMLNGWNEGTEYHDNLTQMADDFINDTDCIADTIIVGQTNRYSYQGTSATRPHQDNVRQAQQDAWGETNNISKGPVTYDINLSIDGLHFRTNSEMQNFSLRWYYSMLDVLYSDSSFDNPIPTIFNLIDNGSNSILRITYDQNIVSRHWNGSTNTLAKGWLIYNLTGSTNYSDSDVLKTNITANVIDVVFDYDAVIPYGSRLYYGSFNDGYNKYVVSGLTTELPSRLIFNETLNVTVSDTCTYSGSGDWTVLCTDNCTITTNTDTTTNALIIDGAVGYFELLANVTCEMFAIEEGCQFRNKMNDNKRLAVKED